VQLGGMTESVSSVSHEAVEAAAASNQTSCNVQAVAAGAEELSASFHEISLQVAHAAGIAQKAVAEAGAAGSMVRRWRPTPRRSGRSSALSATSRRRRTCWRSMRRSRRRGRAKAGAASPLSPQRSSRLRPHAKATGEISKQVASVRAYFHVKVYDYSPSGPPQPSRG